MVVEVPVWQRQMLLLAHLREQRRVVLVAMGQSTISQASALRMVLVGVVQQTNTLALVVWGAVVALGAWGATITIMEGQE